MSNADSLPTDVTEEQDRGLDPIWVYVRALTAVRESSPNRTRTPSPLATVMGRTREQWDAELEKGRNEIAAVVAQRHLDSQWAYMVETFGEDPGP